MKFLIQTIDNQIKHDFSFALLQAIEYQNWYKEGSCTYMLGSYDEFLFHPGLTERYIPIGSVDFVCDYLEKRCNKRPKPQNIPLALFKDEFLKREIILGTEKDIKGMKFVKSMDVIKGYTEIADHTSQVPEGNYLISELIEIESEWRAFVYKNKLVGLQNYSGEFTIFPDVPLIEKMIGEYKGQPIAFTLDVAITDKGDTVIIEVHDFFSCGLYGFSDARILPNMFNSWYQEFIGKL